MWLYRHKNSFSPMNMMAHERCTTVNMSTEECRVHVFNGIIFGILPADPLPTSWVGDVGTTDDKT